MVDLLADPSVITAITDGPLDGYGRIQGVRSTVIGHWLIAIPAIPCGPPIRSHSPMEIRLVDSSSSGGTSQASQRAGDGRASRPA